MIMRVTANYILIDNGVDSCREKKMSPRTNVFADIEQVFLPTRTTHLSLRTNEREKKVLHNR